MRYRRSAVFMAAAVLGATGAAQAADTTTFNVRLIITQACTITAAGATDVDFGSALASSTTELLAPRPTPSSSARVRIRVPRAT